MVMHLIRPCTLRPFSKLAKALRPAQASSEDVSQRLQRLEATEAEAASDLKGAADEAQEAQSQCKQLRSALARAEEEWATARRRKLDNEAKQAAAETAEMECLKETISSLRGQAQALCATRDQAKQMLVNNKLELQSIQQREVELQREEGHLQIQLEARYEEEAHLVESCRDFREVLHRLDAQAESLAAQEDVMSDCSIDTDSAIPSSTAFDQDKLHKAWHLEGELLTAKEQARELRQRLAKVQSEDFSTQKQLGGQKGQAVEGGPASLQALDAGACEAGRDVLVLQDAPTRASGGRQPLGAKRGFFASKLNDTSELDARCVAEENVTLQSEVEEARHQLEMAQTRWQHGAAPHLQAALHESRAKLRSSLQQQLQASQEMLQSLRAGIIQAEEQLEAEHQTRGEGLRRLWDVGECIC
ncbi:unnamed protein product [Durusdinium trenchii]|uniref:Uncharacterized protein n=1 Tax=Durusdinium trenchii TaxID=1381693 RepID=A0ABP0HXK1_9DINO